MTARLGIAVCGMLQSGLVSFCLFSRAKPRMQHGA